MKNEDKMAHMLMVVNAMQALFAGRIDEARNADAGVTLVIDVAAEAFTPGSTKGMARKRMEAATEHDRMIAAGMLNMLERSMGQFKDVLAQVGAKLGDAHVETIAVGCGDPNCPNCGGKGTGDFEKMLKEKVAQMVGIDPDSVTVQQIPANADIEAIMKAAESNGESESTVPADPHMADIMKALDKMPASKRPRLRPKKLPS